MKAGRMPGFLFACPPALREIPTARRAGPAMMNKDTVTDTSMPDRVFEDRRDAGRRLAQALQRLPLQDPVVFGLPRGGVPVAFEVAAALDAPLDVIVVRKLGAPFQPELAIGAIASGNVRVMNEEIRLAAWGIDAGEVEAIAARERAELERRERLYRGGRPLPDVAGRDAILVDDGLATGASMRAAVAALRARGPARLIVAVPTASPRAVRELERVADRVVCLEAPPDFQAVGQFYRRFEQTSDEEVCALLGRAAGTASPEP